MTFQGFQQSFIRKEGNNWQIINIENGDKEMVLGELDARLLQDDQLPTGKVWKEISRNHTTSTSTYFAIVQKKEEKNIISAERLHNFFLLKV